MPAPPTTPPDVAAALIAHLLAVTDADSVDTSAPESGTAVRHLRVRADLGGRITPISRSCTVGLSAWVLTSTGAADLPATFDLAALAGRALEAAAARVTPILAAEVQSGPLAVTDPVTSRDYALTSLLLEVAVGV